MLKSENFIPDVSGRINRSLTLTQKVSPLKAFGDWIHNTATNFYEATQSGHRAWTFYRHHLLISDTHRDFFSEQDQDAIKFDISEGKIYLNGNQTDEVIEMLEQSESGILVCKYAMESSCVPGTEFWLLNTSPATMSVAVEGGGFVDYATEYEHFGKTRELTVTPATGYEVKKVEGCDGHLSGNVYLTAPIRKDCTVVASFQKME